MAKFTLEQAERRIRFAEALEEVAKLADSVPDGACWDTPPRYIAGECRNWARQYSVKVEIKDERKEKEDAHAN